MSAAHCNKCKKSHARPVGKKCTRYLEPTPTGEGATPNQLLLNAIQGLQGTMEGVLERVTSLEAVRSRSRSPSPSQEHLPEHTGSRDKDSIAARVTHALKDFGLDDDGTPAEDTPTGGKNIHSSRKSGRTRTTEDLIVRYVHWPHFGIYKGPSRKPAAYDDLSMPEFVAGYVNCLLRHNTDDNNKDHMLHHLQDLMHDATMYPWRNVRNFHGIVLGMMEQGELNWDDTSTIQQLQQQYARIPHVPTVPMTPDLTPCTKYQTEQCTQAGTHDKLAHVCAWCYRYKGKAFGHPQSKCMSKEQREKNSDGGN